MYRLDKTFCKAQTFAEAEKSKLFAKSDSLSERLKQAWYLSAMAFGIDPVNPPEIKKHIVTLRKHNN